MLKQLICGIAVGLGLLFSGAVASANTIAVTVHLDVANIAPDGGLTGAQGFGPSGFEDPFSVELAEGDTFDFTILFNGTLTLDNPTFLWAYSYANISSDVQGTGTLQLLDGLGSPLFVSAAKTDTEGSAHFGQQFGPSDFASLPASLTFSGLRYIGTVEDYVEPGVTVRTYNNPAFFFTADNFTVESVPDAGSAMLLFGLGLTSLETARRRMRKQTRA